MNSHKLAEILLSSPDLPIATHANNHTYMSGIDELSHGPLKIGVLETYGGQHLVLGDIHDTNINPPNWYVSRMIDESVSERESKIECIWQEDRDGIWETSCGNSHEFFTDGPKENRYKFCCYCGKSLSARKYRRTYDGEHWRDQGQTIPYSTSRPKAKATYLGSRRRVVDAERRR